MTRAAAVPVTAFSPALADYLYQVTSRIARQPDVQAAVETNHDDNQWWPRSVTDWRVRMVVAGWSTRVSYNMVDRYAEVVAAANRLGYECLTKLDDAQLARVIAPLGLSSARVRYFRSLTAFLAALAAAGQDPQAMDADAFIAAFAHEVDQASYKVAQCAVLYARGYHCGIIPVDSGMVDKLAPLLGIRLARRPIAHEQLRHLLQACAQHHAQAYRRLVRDLGYAVTIPAAALPTWWLHLTLIYFKRRYLNRPGPRLCPNRPACRQVLDCACAGTTPMALPRQGRLVL